MASFTKYSSQELRVVVIASGLLIIAFLYHVPITGGVEVPNWGKGASGVKVGSRPPRCSVDKCLNCSPCMATLIAPIHQGKHKASAASSQHDTYYLLAWKCKCGNKLYHP
ncbi:EPIDERMAL PATTERNING FACTOR-like protein 2 isoform X2 [Solanum pennellii]|uniref:Epidermal patterning factor-like protein n=1 Tax=Solanum pennellii TaxID=28526 RepID=A0ABM1HER7_SOLPN|nr:EPIDERMAL PATTERNING FACTOR-like protein 2 isoform X2 [Solanum pennellii]